MPETTETHTRRLQREAPERYPIEPLVEAYRVRLAALKLNPSADRGRPAGVGPQLRHFLGIKHCTFKNYLAFGIPPHRAAEFAAALGLSMGDLWEGASPGD